MSQTAEVNKLISEMQKGNEVAFAELYDRYSPALFGVVSKIIREESLAQDILQDCFVTIWKKAQSFDADKGSFFTWMLNICRNKSIDGLRKQNRESDHLNTMKETDVIETSESAMNVGAIGLNGCGIVT